MIRLFPRTRRIQQVGGALGVLAGFAVAWFATGDQPDITRVLLGTVGAVVGGSVVLWFARMEAIKQYKLTMAHLYTDLDPERFLAEVERLDLGVLTPAEQATTRAHWANGLLADGRPAEALEVLNAIALGEDDRELRFTTAANKVTCYLDLGQAAAAERMLRQAADISKAAQQDRRAGRTPRGPKPGSAGDFWLKARRTQAAQQLHLDIVRGRPVDLGVLERELENNPAPLQRVRVASMLLKAYERSGHAADATRMRAFLLEHGGQTAARRRLPPDAS